MPSALFSAPPLESRPRPACPSARTPRASPRRQARAAVTASARLERPLAAPPLRPDSPQIHHHHCSTHTSVAVRPRRPRPTPPRRFDWPRPPACATATPSRTAPRPAPLALFAVPTLSSRRRQHAPTLDDPRSRSSLPLPSNASPCPPTSGRRVAAQPGHSHYTRCAHAPLLRRPGAPSRRSHGCGCLPSDFPGLGLAGDGPAVPADFAIGQCAATVDNVPALATAQCRQLTTHLVRQKPPLRHVAGFRPSSITSAVDRLSHLPLQPQLHARSRLRIPAL